MSLPVVPTDSNNEKQHRTVIATVLNEIAKQFPQHAPWTPVVRGSVTAGTYEIASNFSRYTRIGRRVWLDVGVVFAAVITGGGAGNLRIAAPFTKAANTFPIGTVQTAGPDWDAGAVPGLAFTDTAATADLFIREQFDNAVAQQLAIAAISANDSIFGSICYETDDP